VQTAPVTDVDKGLSGGAPRAHANAPVQIRSTTCTPCGMDTPRALKRPGERAADGCVVLPELARDVRRRHGRVLGVVACVGGERLHLGETGPLSQGVQARRNALRTRHINGMEVHRKRPRGFK
jgi:hypothetical protein